MNTHRHLPRYRTAIPASLLVGGIAGILCSGCTTIPLPASDPTPPVLTWTVYNYGTGTQQQYSGNGTVNTRIGERFRVTLKAEDSDGGVSRIEWSRSDGWTCSNGTIGQNSGPSLGAVTGQSLSPNAQNQVVTSVVLIQDVDLNFTCQPGLSFKSGSTVLQGTGKNHHSGATAGQLVFNVGP